MKTKIGIISLPHKRSSYVMSKFDEAGFVLGDVDRRKSEDYPAGRLELWPLARLTSGKPKDKPVPKEQWPHMDLSAVQVAKAMPAWVPILKAHGFNYWIACSRGQNMGAVVAAMEYDEVINSYTDFDPHEIWERANGKISAGSGPAPGLPSAERPRKRGRPKGSGRKSNSEGNEASNAEERQDQGALDAG